MPQPQRRRLIDLDAIAEAAMQEIDDTGDFSMPRIARRLGVSAPAIYHHVEGRAEIVDLIRSTLFDMHFGDFRALPWPEAVRAWANAYRSIFAVHPNLVNLLVRYSIRDPRALAGFDQLAQILDAAGVPDEQLIVWVTLFDSFTLSVALFAVAPGELWDTSRCPAPTLERAIAAGPHQPHLADEAFTIGLASLIDRLRATLNS